MARCAAIPLLGLLLLSAGARAHQGEHPLTLRLLLKADGLHLAMDYSLTGEPARAWRQACDADSDGRVDPAEREACLAAQRARWLQALAVRFDGRAVEPVLAPPGPARLSEPADSDSPVTASLQALFPYAPGGHEHTLEIGVAPEVPGGHAPLFLQVGRALALGAHSGQAFERSGVRLVEEVLQPGRVFRAVYSRASCGAERGASAAPPP